MDDCGDVFCSARCEREYDRAHRCKKCEEDYDELNEDGLCEYCEEEEEDADDD